jgi:putative transposase
MMKKSTRKSGQPRTPEDIRSLVLRIARETGWGDTRILGQLRKIGIRAVSRTTVINILKEHGLDPGPQRGQGTWDDFIRRHASTIWACDFFSKKVWTFRGLVDVFVMFFLHIETRRVYVAGMTVKPDRARVAQQARNAALHFAEQAHPVTHVPIDRDAKFVPEFDRVFGAEGVEVRRLGPLAPNLNAYAERCVQSVKQERLDHFMVFDERHLRYLLREYVTHYHQERPHQALGNTPPVDAGSPEAIPRLLGEVFCQERLGGLLRYHVRAA